PAVSVADASYSSPLDLASTYYWRIDEVNDIETPTTWQGDLWDFTTRDRIVVEDFEDYNDWPPHEIYTTWLDGYVDPANGSQVGNLTPPLAETTIVHGGLQSMPLFYSNTGGATYSEGRIQRVHAPLPLCRIGQSMASRHSGCTSTARRATPGRCTSRSTVPRSHTMGKPPT
ncbi:MAG: hypothetical protein ACYTEK_22455, partial [Planctomycetota bacterium]